MAYGFGATLGSGTTDKVTTALTSSSTQRTYAAWVYGRTLTPGRNMRIIEKDLEALFWWNDTSDLISFSRFFSGTDGSWALNVPIYDNATWRHYMITYDSSATTNDPIFYKNGGVSTSVTETATPTGTADTNSNAHLIGNSAASDRCWDGMLAEVAIWDRILTAAEALIVFKGSPLACPLSLVEYVPLVRNLVSYKNTAPTVTGTIIQPHPKISYPSDYQRTFSATTAAGGSSGKPTYYYNQLRAQ